MIYLNNAASSWPKPEIVRKTAAQALEALPVGQYRSSVSSDAEDILHDTRTRLGILLGVREPDRIFFSSGATESLNLILQGLQIPAAQIITTVTEHNSVLRPLYNLTGDAGQPVLLPCDRDGYVPPEALEKEAAGGKARVFVMNHCSNVTGSLQDAAAFGEIAHRYGLLFVLDCAQSAGCLPIEGDDWGVDALAFTGHKSLLGVQGTGGFWLRRGLRLRPLLYGGTGRDSVRLRYEDTMPPDYEAGTRNAPGIAALGAAASFLISRGLPHIAAAERTLRAYATEILSGLPRLRLLSVDGRPHGPVLSMVSDLLSPADLAYILQNSYGIVTRAGLQCAPLVHGAIGSGAAGTLRISFSPFTQESEIDALADALREILS
ncbi:MAG: aminotransferase class V-fold PLP-dependent enzyme [Butyrivibrio sp.]|nr:aminotransferase class V-fold PLP-dependent enzyme [Butyrivibrio sp.]